MVEWPWIQSRCSRSLHTETSVRHLGAGAAKPIRLSALLLVACFLAACRHSAPPTIDPPSQAAPPSVSTPGEWILSTPQEPDASRLSTKPALVYVEETSNGGLAVFAATLPLDKPALVTPPGIRVSGAAVSSDGNWLAYYRRLDAGIGRVCLNGMVPVVRQCWDAGGTIDELSWRPNSTKLYIRMAGGGAFRLQAGTTQAPVFVRFPNRGFSPDGGWSVQAEPDRYTVSSISPNTDRLWLIRHATLHGWMDANTLLANYGSEAAASLWLESPGPNGDRSHIASLPDLIVPTVTGSPDGRWLAALQRMPGAKVGEGDEDIARRGPLHLVLYNRQTKQWQPVLDGSEPWRSPSDAPARLYGFSPDGRFLAVGLAGDLVRIYEVGTGHWRASLTVSGLAINGRYIWSYGGALLAVDVGPDARSSGVAFLDIGGGGVLDRMGRSRSPFILWLGLSVQ